MSSPSSLGGSWCLLPSPPLSPTSSKPLKKNLLRTQILTHHWQWKQCVSKGIDALSGEDWCETTVPTEIFMDLLQTGAISDPFLELNETDVQWVGEVDWVYKTQFDLKFSLGDEEKAVLVFEGLDTLAYVYLNGKEILRSEVSPFSRSALRRTCFMSLE